MINVSRLGLVINPIAGMGAKFAWKGTDDIEKAWDLVQKGEKQVSYDIAKRAISSITNNDIEWLVTDKQFSSLGKVVYEMPKRSKPIHTKKAVQELVMQKVELIIFVGGDGTAAIVGKETYERKIPILGIPAGVKIFSGVFLHKPEDLGIVLDVWDGKTKVVEIEDLDEEEYKKGRIIPKLVSAAYVPAIEQIQVGKSTFHQKSDEDTYRLIAQRIEEEGWLHGTILVGSGSTMQQIFIHMGLEKSLLGIDVFNGRERVLEDATYDELRKMRIDEVWVTPIGSQGHLFGRGNRQIPPDILKNVGKKGIRVFATPEKMQATPMLYIDTGDAELDKALQGYYKVVISYHESVLRKAE